MTVEVLPFYGTAFGPDFSGMVPHFSQSWFIRSLAMEL